LEESDSLAKVFVDEVNQLVDLFIEHPELIVNNPGSVVEYSKHFAKYSVESK
jgi:hypothetical protein